MGWEGLHKFLLVIANKVTPSKSRLKSRADGSPRRFAPRDDGVLQRIPDGPGVCAAKVM
jgi:hypothetical protein